MARPDFVARDVDEACALVNSPLTTRLAAEEAVDVADSQVGHVLGRGDDAIAHVAFRVEAEG